MIGCDPKESELEAKGSDRDARVLVSLRPEESAASAASKLKGQISKWLSQQLGPAARKTLGTGYFALTSGKTDTQTVEAYLQRQSEHHGYGDRAQPPVFIRQYDISEFKLERLQSQHAVCRLQFHLVLGTTLRRPIFSEMSGEALAAAWLALATQSPFALRKISVVPDHVHAAVRTHPSAPPGNVMVSMMNAAQEMMWRNYRSSMEAACVLRLWEPGGYVGSFGDLSSPQIRQYIREWSP